MNELKEMQAIVGDGVECCFSCGLKLKMKPFGGDYLPSIFSILEEYTKADLGNIDPTDDNAVIEAMKDFDVGKIQDLYDLMYDWVDMNIKKDDNPEREGVISTFVNKNMMELLGFFKDIHGFDKKTMKEELVEEVADIRSRNKKRDARRPRKNRNGIGNTG